MNNVTLIGNLATDVETRSVGSGDDAKTVGSFLLAVNRNLKDRDEADFIRVTTWNGQAESCAKYLTKGKKVGVEGRLRSSTFEKDGEKRYSLEVVAQRVEFLTPAPKNGESQAQQESQAAAVASGAGEDDIPF